MYQTLLIDIPRKLRNINVCKVVTCQLLSNENGYRYNMICIIMCGMVYVLLLIYMSTLSEIHSLYFIKITRSDNIYLLNTVKTCLYWTSLGQIFQYIQTKLRRISYIETFFEIHFVQNCSLFKVWFRQFHCTC